MYAPSWLLRQFVHSATLLTFLVFSRETLHVFLAPLSNFQVVSTFREFILNFPVTKVRWLQKSISRDTILNCTLIVSDSNNRGYRTSLSLYPNGFLNNSEKRISSLHGVIF